MNIKLEYFGIKQTEDGTIGLYRGDTALTCMRHPELKCTSNCAGFNINGVDGGRIIIWACNLQTMYFNEDGTPREG